MDDGILIEVIHCSHDAILEFLFGCDADVAQDGASEFGKETLDEVEPGAVLGSESEFEAVRGLIAKPGFGLFGDVSRMIVEDQLDRCMVRIGGIEKLEDSMNSRLRWRSLTRAWTLPVTRSMPASKLTVPLRLYS